MEIWLIGLFSMLIGAIIFISPLANSPEWQRQMTVFDRYTLNDSERNDATSLYSRTRYLKRLIKSSDFLMRSAMIFKYSGIWKAK